MQEMMLRISKNDMIPVHRKTSNVRTSHCNPTDQPTDPDMINTAKNNGNSNTSIRLWTLEQILYYRTNISVCRQQQQQQPQL